MNDGSIIVLDDLDDALWRWVDHPAMPLPADVLSRVRFQGLSFDLVPPPRNLYGDEISVGVPDAK